MLSFYGKLSIHIKPLRILNSFCVFVWIVELYAMMMDGCTTGYTMYAWANWSVLCVVCGHKSDWRTSIYLMSGDVFIFSFNFLDKLWLRCAAAKHILPESSSSRSFRSILRQELRQRIGRNTPFACIHICVVVILVFLLHISLLLHNISPVHSLCILRMICSILFS